MVEYSIVIPAYNEAARISATLTHIIGFMDQYAKSYEIIVVNDGSKDNTAELVKMYSQEHPQVILLDKPHRGKGPTIWSGVTSSHGSYIYMYDADSSSPITEIKKLSLWLKEHNYDIAIASRGAVGSRRVNEPLYRHLMGKVFNLFVQLIAIKGISDTQCGYKLFKRKAAQDIFARLKIYGDSAKELEKPYLGAWDVEVLFVAKKLGYKIKEVPVVWTYVTERNLNHVEDSLKMLIDVIKVRINDFKGLYN